MKRKRFTEEQIIAVLRDAESGVSVQELCRARDVEHDVLQVADEVRRDGRERSAPPEAARGRESASETPGSRPRLGHPDAEVGELERVVGPAVKREAARWLVQGYTVSERRACRTMELGLSTFHYVSRREDGGAVRGRLLELAAERPRFGYRRLCVLLRREGHRVNPKRVYRLYRQEGLKLRRQKRKRVSRHPRQPLAEPARPNDLWSLDFVSDQLASGRRFRVLNVVDDYSREALACEAQPRFLARPSCECSSPSRNVVATRSRSCWTTAPSSPAAYSTHGPTESEFSYDSSSPASRLRTLSLRASTASSGTNASISTGSSTWRTPSGSSKTGARTTTRFGLTALSAT